MSVRPHKNLKVWQLSIEFIPIVYQITKSLPDDEKFGLTSQIKRAAVSIPANIAEGAAKNSTKDFIRFLYISMCSLSELDTHFEIALKLNFITEKDYQTLISESDKISALLNGLINSLKKQIT